MTEYGIYRERPRSAVLIGIMLGRAAALLQAEALSDNLGGVFSVAATTVEVIRFNDPTAPPMIHRFGDWDSRSAWQPRMERRP